MKKRSWLILVVSCLLVVSLLLIACPTPEPPPTPAPPTPAPPAPPAQPTVIKLKWAGFQPPTAAATIEAKMFTDLLTKQSKGTVEVTYYPTSQLGKATDFVDMLKGGVCDIADIGGAYFPTLFQVTTVTELPLLGIPHITAAMYIRYELFYKGYLDYGLKDLKLLFFNMSRPFCLWTRPQVLKAEDFGGLNLRGSGRTMTQPFEAFGASSVSMVSSDVGMALERGLIDGTVTSPDFLLALQWQEVCKYGVSPPLLYGGSFVVMSQSTWDSLPPDIQVIFGQVSQQWLYQVQEYYQDLDEDVYSQLGQAGVKISSIEPTELARWQKAAEGATNDWIAAREAEGLPGKEIVEEVQRIIERYQ